MLTSTFAEATQRFQSFLAQQGVNGRIIWVWPEDVVWAWGRLFVSPKNGDARAKAAYDRVVRCGGHARFQALGVVKSGVVAFIIVAETDKEACDLFLRDLTLSIRTSPSRVVELPSRILLHTLRRVSQGNQEREIRFLWFDADMSY